MRYCHERQEVRYQRWRHLGRAVDYAGKSFDDFDLRPFLESALAGLSFPSSTMRALEYGTGTGPGACFLAAHGFQVDAMDVSPTAIELAKIFAADRGLHVHYEIQDICRLRGRRNTYDLVVDNYCLHCLVTDEQRRRALAVVHSVLKPRGYYVVGSVVFRDDRDVGDDEYDEATGILYHKLGAASQGYEDAVQRSGSWWAPRARHVRPDDLKVELEQAGFHVLRQDGGRVLCDKGPDM